MEKKIKPILEGDQVFYKGMIYALWQIVGNDAILLNSISIKPLFFRVPLKMISITKQGK